MKQTYIINGMTCTGCKSKVEHILGNLDEVTSVNVNLETKTAEIETTTTLDAASIEAVLPKKYKVQEASVNVFASTDAPQKSELKQLFPLFLIFFYITTASLLLQLKFPAYAWIYPFLEVILGLMFLIRIEIPIALIATIVILGITTIGVTKSLLDNKTIQCACLGTALKLPMTKATFIENSIMLIMAVWMLINIYA
jgi:copper chaperone CopZ